MTYRAALLFLSAVVCVSMNAGTAAASRYHTLSLACENGRNYPVHDIAVSDAGELVTGRLMLAPRRGVHVRLVPMGLGYRYAGRGVWFDGFRERALLNLGFRRSIPCTVVASEGVVLRVRY